MSDAAEEKKSGSSGELKERSDTDRDLRRSTHHHHSKDRDRDRGKDDLRSTSHRKSSHRDSSRGGSKETEEERAERKRREREREKEREKETEEERAERKKRERERDTRDRDKDRENGEGDGDDDDDDDNENVDAKDPYGLGSRRSGRSSGDRAKSSRHLSHSSREGSSRHLDGSARSKSERHLSSEDRARSSRHLRPKETEEERAERKRRERERENETEEERAERKRKERERDKERDKDRDRRSSARDKETEEERAERKRRERERDRDRHSSDKRGSRRSSDHGSDRRRSSSRRHHEKETEEERAERKKKEREERDREKQEQSEREKEKEEKREREREERKKKDEEAKREREKEREAMREEKRKEKEAKYGKQSTTLQVNRGDLRAKSTEKFNNVYSLGKLIYKSDDCKVHVCHHRATGTERAVKITPKKLSSCHEFDMLKQVDHPNVLTMYDLFDEEGEDGFEFYLVIDLCKGGTLHRVLMVKLGKEMPVEKNDEQDDMFGLGGFVSALTGQEEEEEEEEDYEADGYGLEEETVKKIMQQLLSCVNYLHKNKLIHADLKPQNVLLPNRKDFDAVKIIDFDNSVLLRKADDKISSKKGTPEYMAPEVHAGQKYDYKCDVWSCGCIAYQLLSNSLPFGDSEEIGEEEVRKRVEEGTFKLAGPSWGAVSQEAKDFVKSLLVVREKKRPTALKALSHPWIAALNEGGDPNDGKPAATLTLDKDPAAMMAMSNFRKFSADTKLKKATCSFIASQLLTKEEKDKIDTIFRAMDITNDGKLSKTEVKAGFFQVFGTFLSDTEIDEIFNRVDCDGTGEIEYSEFVIASMAESDLLSQDRLRKAFQLFDKDNSGSITISELREIFSFFITAGADMDDAYIDQVIAAVDSSGDGEVSFDEFVDMMTSNVF